MATNVTDRISLRTITRLTGISRTTLIKLLEDAGQAFSEYQDRALMNLPCKHLQVDDAWAFCYAKQKNVPIAKAAPKGAGDIWTWVGLYRFTERCKLIDVIFRVRQNVFGSVFPMLQQIRRIISSSRF